MIARALTFIESYLNQQIKMTFGLDEDKVVLGSLINLDGSVTDNIENKIVISIINLEHEKTVKHIGNYRTDASGSFAKARPPIHLNLYVLISANYNSKNYLESLKMLSSVIGIFQANPVFTSNSHPEMDSAISKLTFETYNIPIKELSHIWGGIGAKYVPSMLYKIRMITIDKTMISGETSGITGLGMKSN